MQHRNSTVTRQNCCRCRGSYRRHRVQQERRVVAVVVGEGVAVVAAAEGLEAAVEAAEVAAVEAAAVEDSEAAEVAAEVVVEAAAVEAAAVEAVAVVGGKIFPVSLAFHNRCRQCTRAHAHTRTCAHMHTCTHELQSTLLLL